MVLKNIGPKGAPGMGLALHHGDAHRAGGAFDDATRRFHGLFFAPPNNFFTFDYPGSTFTSLNGINDKGVICGRYVDAAGTHGFLARVRGTPPTTPAGAEMKANVSPSLVTPLDLSPSAWGGAVPAR